MTILRRLRGWFAGTKWRPGVWALLLAGAVVYLWFRPPAWVSEERRQAPDIAVALTDGRTLALDQLRGKVVLVNFWATWCPYCRHEMPALDAFYRDYRGHGFEILALSEDDDPAAARRFMQREAYAFPAGAADAASMAAFGGVRRLPTSLLIDKRGNVRYRISGQVYYGRLKALVEPLLAE